MLRVQRGTGYLGIALGMLCVVWGRPSAADDGGRAECVVHQLAFDGWRCFYACWDPALGDARCSKAECCPNGCAAEEIPDGGVCTQKTHDLPCHERTSMFVAGLRTRAAFCESDHDCEKMTEGPVSACFEINETMGQRCVPRDMPCPLRAPAACIAHLCATRGTKDAKAAWDLFERNMKKLDDERLARGEFPGLRPDAGESQLGDYENGFRVNSWKRER